MHESFGIDLPHGVHYCLVHFFLVEAFNKFCSVDGIECFLQIDEEEKVFWSFLGLELSIYVLLYFLVIELHDTVHVM